MVILNPWVSTLKVWIVSRKGNNLLIKSILTGCGPQFVISFVLVDVNLVRLDLQKRTSSKVIFFVKFHFLINSDT